MKSSQDKLPTSLQATAAATPKATPTKKTATDLQLSTLPAVPGVSEPAAKCRTENERILEEPKGGPGPGGPGPGPGPGPGVGQAKVKIAPELDEVVVVSTSTMESTATSSHARHPPRVQQRKGVNLGFCRNQEVRCTFFLMKTAIKFDFFRDSTSPDIASICSPSLDPWFSSASSCSGWTKMGTSGILDHLDGLRGDHLRI